MQRTARALPYNRLSFVQSVRLRGGQNAQDVQRPARALPYNRLSFVQSVRLRGGQN